MDRALACFEMVLGSIAVTCVSRLFTYTNFMRRKFRVKFQPAEFYRTSIETFPPVFSPWELKPLNFIGIYTQLCLMKLTPGLLIAEVQLVCLPDNTRL